MWNRHQFSQSGLLTAVALCSALSFTACSDSDDDPGAADAADATVRDSASDVRREAEAGNDAASDVRTTDGATDARVAETGADARNDVAAEATADAGAEAAVDAARDAVAETGADARTEAATPDAGADVRVEAAVDTGVDAADAGTEAEAAVVPVDTGVTPVDAGTDATTVEAASDGAVDGAVQSIRYDFEGDLQNWIGAAAPDGGTSPLTVALSTAQASSGTRSLIVNFASPDSHEISALNPPAGLERGTFTFRIFVPTTSTLTLLKPFTSTNEDHLAYDESLVFANTNRGSWQTYTATFPLTYTVDGGTRTRTTIEQIGFQLEGTGAIYIDSITY